MQHDEIKGFTDQSEQNKALVNINKEAEERVLRILDSLTEFPAVDQRMLALGRTNVQQAFMWINRAIFQPQRVVLPEDSEPELAPPPIHIGPVFRDNDPITRMEKVHDGNGRVLVADGPHWYRQDEYEPYKAAVEAKRNENAQVARRAGVAKVVGENAG